MSVDESFPKEERLTSKEALTYGWNYFQLHATQRMSLFNFYIILASLLTTGIVTASQEKFKNEFVPVFLSLMLTVLSFVFWKLDCRVKFLLKHIEDVLKNIEVSTKGTVEEKMFDVFGGEEAKTKTSKTNNTLLRPQTYHLSYSKCLGLVYLFFGVLGVFSFCYTFLRLYPLFSFCTIQEIFHRFLCTCNCSK